MVEHPILGPAYLGQKEFEKQVAASRASGGGVLGPAFTDDPNPNRSSHTARFQLTGDASSLSVKDLKAALELDGGLVEALFAAEVERPDGARRSALQALAYAENSKAEPNKALLKSIRAGASTASASTDDGGEQDSEGTDEEE